MVRQRKKTQTQNTEERRVNPPRQSKFSKPVLEHPEDDDHALPDTDLEPMSSDGQGQNDEQEDELVLHLTSESEDDPKLKNKNAPQTKAKMNFKANAAVEKRRINKRKADDSSSEKNPLFSEEDEVSSLPKKQNRNAIKERNVSKKVKQKVVAEHQRIEDGILKDKLQKYLDKSRPLLLPESPDYQLVKFPRNFREDDDSMAGDEEKSKSDRFPEPVVHDEFEMTDNFKDLYDIVSEEKKILQQKCNQLRDAHKSLMKENSDLQKKYVTKIEQHQAALKRNSLLQERIDALEDKCGANGIQDLPGGVQAVFDSMTEENRAYKENFAKLQIKFRSLQTLYKNLESEFFAVVNDTEELSTTSKLRTARSYQGHADLPLVTSPKTTSTTTTCPKSSKVVDRQPKLGSSPGLRSSPKEHPDNSSVVRAEIHSPPSRTVPKMLKGGNSRHEQNNSPILNTPKKPKKPLDSSLTASPQLSSPSVTTPKSSLRNSSVQDQQSSTPKLRTPRSSNEHDSHAVSPQIPSTSGVTPKSLKKLVEKAPVHAKVSKTLFKQEIQTKNSSEEKKENVEENSDSRFPRSFTIRNNSEKKKMKDLGDGVIIDGDTWLDWMKQNRPSMFAKLMLRHFYSPNEIAERSVSGDPLLKTPRGINSRKKISPNKAKAMKRSYEHYRKEKKPTKDGGLNLYLREEIKSVVAKKKKDLEEEKIKQMLSEKITPTSQESTRKCKEQDDSTETSDDE